MNVKDMKKSIRGIFRKLEKYKYVGLVLMLGILLMLIPAKDSTQKTIEHDEIPEDEVAFSEELEKILCMIEGTGKTKVLLTMENGVKSVYQTDIEIDQTDSTKKEQIKTVLASSGSGTESPLVKETVYPSYRGALIVCQGADRASVRLNVTKAVSSLTGLSSDKITVIKMNSD